ncbi:MAG: N-acetyl sugar amidotransferase [Planctomycetes bacterium]|nr:N-acetyl sugar amidotransferase [Planctomycetota bacterium]
MNYCTKCLMPRTKPHLSFDENGICGACSAHQKKNEVLGGIDWQQRKQQFNNLLEQAKDANTPHYDVLVPVSGGKDSITQVHRVLNRGLRILAVNVDYGIKTEIGKQNLECIAEMGADLVIFRPRQPLHKRLIRLGLEDFGDPDLLSHTLLHAYPQHVALQYEIPLVVLGENAAFEYSGESDEVGGNCMTRQWFDRYAANQGQDARFISKQYHIPFVELRFYDYPDEIATSNTRAEFLSHYFSWDSQEHLKIAQSYGFNTLNEPSEGTYRNFVGLDEKIHRIHQYLKVMKFGYGRATDHACEDIRNGRLTREKAKLLVAKHDLIDISNSILNDVADYLEISSDSLSKMIEKYRNPDIWQRTSDGCWNIPNHLQDEVVAAGV